MKESYFIAFPTAMLDDKNLSRSAFHLYLRILGLSNKQGFCFAGNSYLSKAQNCSIRAVQKHLSELVNLGYLRIKNSEPDKRELWPLAHAKNFMGGCRNLHGGVKKISPPPDLHLIGVNKDKSNNAHASDQNEIAPSDLANRLMKECQQTMERAQMAAVRSSLDFKHEVLTCILYYQSNGQADLPLNQLARKVELWMQRGGDFMKKPKGRNNDQYIPPSKRQ